MANREIGYERDAVFAEIAALGERDYPVIGVPTFLIGEACPGANPASAMPGVPDPLAIYFAALASAMSAGSSPMTIAGIGQLLELLADRHFFDGEPTPFSKIATLHLLPE